MTLKLRSLVLTLAAIVCFSASLPSLHAQDESLSSLTLGQPVSSTVSAEEPARYNYTLSESSVVTIQVISETAQPTITLVKDGLSVASEPNEADEFVTSLTTYLASGAYEVEIGTANNAEGTIVAVVQSETPVQVSELVLGTPITGEMSTGTAVAIYHLTALTEPSVISLTSGLTTGSATATLWNETLNRQSGSLSTDLLGGTFQLPANGASYRLEISYSSLAPLEPFTLCWFAASAGGCTGTANPGATPDAISTATQTTSLACTVTPASGAVNVRASASTSAPIVASLAFGASADVIGLSPDGTFYNIQLTNSEGWVATSVVNTGGECSNVPLKNPPDFVPVPTATSAPTQSAQPTQPAATQPPTATATLMPSATPSGPCLLTLNSPVKVYTEPIEKVDFLYDQVQSGELIPVGRLADGSWWKTNYANAWVPTYLFGSALTVSGNCALPIVQP